MRILFKCANCLKETEFSVPAKITLICQSCGCADISFSKKVLVKPDNPGQAPEEPVVISEDEPFLGRSSKGNIWSISLYSSSPQEKKAISLQKRKK